MNAVHDIPLVYREQVRRGGKRTTHVRLAHAALRCEVPLHEGGVAFSIDGGELEGRYLVEGDRLWVSAPPGSEALVRATGTDRFHVVDDAGEVILDDDYDMRSETIRVLATQRCRSHGGELFVPAHPPCWGVLVDALRGKVELSIVSRDRLGPCSVLLPLARRDTAAGLATAVAERLSCPWSETSTLSLRGGAGIDVPCPSLDEQEREIAHVTGAPAQDSAFALLALARRLTL